MNSLEFSAAIGLVAFIAGLLGSLTGLGGGVVIVPLLTLYFDVDRTDRMQYRYDNATHATTGES